MLRFPKRLPELQALLTTLESIAPLRYADVAWDNVGLILESTKAPSRIMVTVDLTEPVAVEAVNAGCDFVIAYHPPWFRPAKSLTMQAGKEARQLAYLASHNVSVYSPHTALDNCRPGINDWVLEHVLGATNTSPMIPLVEDVDCGAGRIVRLSSPIKLSEVLKLVSSKFNLPTMRYALGLDHSQDTLVSSVAVCVGSGASVLAKLKEPVDLFLTGEMSHHELLKATMQDNVSVILTEHTNMERAFLFGPFVDRLNQMTDIDIVVSEQDADPVLFYKQD